MSNRDRILPKLTPDLVAVAVRAVCSAFRINEQDLRSRAGEPQLVAARHALRRLLYENTSSTAATVGVAIGLTGRSVLRSTEHARAWEQTNPAYAEAYKIAERVMTR